MKPAFFVWLRSGTLAVIYHFYTILFPQAPGHSGGIATIYSAGCSAETKSLPDIFLFGAPGSPFFPLSPFCGGRDCLPFSDMNIFHSANKLNKKN